MQEHEIGKDELVLTAPEALGRHRSKPTLVQMGNRLVSSDGRFHPALAAEYLLGHARKQWAKVADLSKVFCGANTIDGKRRVRRNMFHVFTALLNKGEFLVYETALNGRIHAVKLLDASSEQELQMAKAQTERMRQRHQLSTAKYEKTLQVIALRECL